MVDAIDSEARRLTSHSGMELFPKISPDIEVVDQHEQLAKCIDLCIEKAVEVLLKEL